MATYPEQLPVICRFHFYVRHCTRISPFTNRVLAEIHHAQLEIETATEGVDQGRDRTVARPANALRVALETDPKLDVLLFVRSGMTPPPRRRAARSALGASGTPR